MEKIVENKNTIRIIKGSIVAVVLSLILLLIFAILLTYTNISETTIKPTIIAIAGVSILVGSSISTLTIKKNGILNGGLIGLIYILTIYLISSITGTGFALNLYSIIMILVGIITGIIGGIIGVNIQ